VAELKQSVSVGDLVVPTAWTIGQLKEWLSSNKYVPLKPEEMVIVEEETEEQFNLLIGDDKTLSSYG
jgi:putative AlgH/UPF0301 family transcriptional regulator